MKFIFAFLFSVSLISACTDSTSPTEEHYAAEGIMIIKPSTGDTALLHWRGQTDSRYSSGLEVDSGAQTTFLIYFLDSNKTVLPEPEEEEESLRVELADDEFAQVAYPEINKWSFVIIPLMKGKTQMEAQIIHGDHPDFRSGKFDFIIK